MAIGKILGGVAPSPLPRTPMTMQCIYLCLSYASLQQFVCHQLGTFFVNGEWVCGGLFAVCGEIRTHRSRTRSAESAGPLRVILDSVGYY